jgi:hypothetical protein
MLVAKQAIALFTLVIIAGPDPVVAKVAGSNDITVRFGRRSAALM